MKPTLRAFLQKTYPQNDQRRAGSLPSGGCRIMDGHSAEIIWEKVSVPVSPSIHVDLKTRLQFTRHRRAGLPANDARAGVHHPAVPHQQGCGGGGALYFLYCYAMPWLGADTNVNDRLSPGAGKRRHSWCPCWKSWRAGRRN